MAKHVLIQLSDVHLTSRGTLRSGAEPRANFHAALALIERAALAPDALIFTGDLADEGEPSCYQELRSLVERCGGASGASVIFVPGNHDDRAVFRAELLDQAPSDEPINQVHDLDGLRVVSIDSTIAGSDAGALAPATLAFLKGVLADPAPNGTIVALHHPPITTPIEAMDRLRLANPGELEAVLAGSDVRLVLCGHNHHASLGVLGAVPVWSAPACAYRADVASTKRFRPVPGCALSLVELDDAGPVVSVMPVPLA